MVPLNLSKPNRAIRCGVILMGGETEILDVAPIDFLHVLSKHWMSSIPDGAVLDLYPESIKKQSIDFEFIWVSEKGPQTNSKLTSGISLTPSHSFEDCPTLDIVIIGAHNILRYQPNEKELQFVRDAYDSCSAFISICAGVEIPRLAGLLKGKTATGPRFYLDVFREHSPETTWIEKRWVRDGKLWSSGSSLNGLELMHNFCHEYWGGENSLCSQMAKIGAWPNRDVDYKDVTWRI